MTCGLCLCYYYTERYSLTLSLSSSFIGDACYDDMADCYDYMGYGSEYEGYDDDYY